MNKLLFVFIIICTFSTAFSGAYAQDREFRGLWVHNWRPGLLSPAEVDETIRWARETNMNALIVQVRRVGDAYYNSAYEPRATNIRADAGFDPLAYTIRKGRENGQDVHAWFNLYRVWTAPEKPEMPGHVVNKHPEWLSKNVNGSTSSGDGQYLDPGVPEVREFLVKLISDLVSKYDIDGLMLDYVRYPGKDWGYNDIAVARFNAAHGRTGRPSPDCPVWSNWRRNQVTETVRAIRQEVTRLKPEVKLSAATIVWGSCPSDFTKTSAYSAVFQDWRLWMEQGLLDANMPMNYKNPSNASHNRYYSEWLNGLKRWSYGRHVYNGLMVYGNNVSGVASQISQTRARGLDGTVGFAFSQVDCNPALASKLKSSVFARPAGVPVMPRIARASDDE